MKRLALLTASALILALALAAPALRADVKTTQKTTFKLAGMLGAIVNRMAGGADGITSNVALKGARKLRATDSTGEIIDLTEQKVYTLDMKKKEYTVKTFDEMRAEFEKARADAQKSAAGAKPDEKAQAEPDQQAKQMEFDVDVKETGQHKTIVGHDAHEVIVTISGHEKGKKIEESGGFIMANDIWMAAKIASLDEIRAFDLKYYQALYGQAFAMDMRQAAQTMAAYPQFASFAQKMQAEGGKLQGTPLMTTTTFDSVKSAADMKDQQQQPAQSSSGGGGLGGMFAKKIMGGRGNDQPSGPRSTVLTTSNEYLTLDPAVSDADVALPAGFKLKK